MNYLKKNMNVTACYERKKNIMYNAFAVLCMIRWHENISEITRRNYLPIHYTAGLFILSFCQLLILKMHLKLDKPIFNFCLPKAIAIGKFHNDIDRYLHTRKSTKWTNKNTPFEKYIFIFK
jgi:hypothetical protein